MAVNIDQLRADRRLTAEREGWSAEDRREIDAAIKAALEAGEEAALEGWARHLGWWREMLSSFGSRLREFEASARSRRKS